MRTITFIFISITIIMSGNSCSKKTDDTPTNFVGNWTLAEVYGNDYWGGPLYWSEAKADTRIVFTSDGKYYRKYAKDNDYTLIGTYKKLTDSTIQITWLQPPNPSAPSYILNYNFSKGRYMTWGPLAYEGVVEEKFRLNN
jgi:hypothetical protein